MKAADISLANMKHVKTQHYHINCNWKVFCDNYLVRLSAMLWMPIAGTCPNSWPLDWLTQHASPEHQKHLQHAVFQQKLNKLVWLHAMCDPEQACGEKADENLDLPRWLLSIHTSFFVVVCNSLHIPSFTPDFAIICRHWLQGLAQCDTLWSVRHDALNAGLLNKQMWCNLLWRDRLVLHVPSSSWAGKQLLIVIIWFHKHDARRTGVIMCHLLTWAWHLACI